MTTILAGSSVGKNPQGTFGMNVPAEEFAALSRANAIPADRWRNGFVPVVVDAGETRILFDTGLDTAATVAALNAAGIAADSIGMVVLTHMHGDHIGGLMTGDGPTFAAARHLAGREEFDFWAGEQNKAFEAKVRPLADRLTLINGGDEILPGITAIPTAGHTPGHLSFMVESEGQRLLIGGDVANHYVWSLARPDWEVRFDRDKAEAAATRRRVLTMVAAEGIAYTGYHLPFPAVGFVTAEGDGFRFLPATYQFTLTEAG